MDRRQGQNPAMAEGKTDAAVIDFPTGGTSCPASSIPLATGISG